MLSTGDVSSADEVRLLLERAHLLTELGRGKAAQADRLRILGIEPENRDNLFDLGRLLVNSGQSKAAQIVYEEALKF